MIKRFLHKGLEAFFLRGDKTGLSVDDFQRLRVQLHYLDLVYFPEEMNQLGWDLRQVTGGKRTGWWTVYICPRWRLQFLMCEGDAEFVDLQPIMEIIDDNEKT